MGMIDNLKEAHRNATGAALGAIGSILSLPHATISGLSSAVQGKSFTDASTSVMERYAAIGQSIGREQANEITRALIEAHTRRPV